MDLHPEPLDALPRLLDQCSYALIDPTTVEAEWWKHLPVHPLAPSQYADRAAQLPYVLPLRTLSVEQRNALHAQMIERDRASHSPLLCLLIESEQTLGHIVRHGSRMLIVNAPDDGKAYQLRYHDPHTLTQLAWLFDADQWRTLLGPATAWLIPLQGWQRLTPDSNAVAAPTLRLHPGQWPSLRRVGTIHRLLAQQQTPVAQHAVEGRKLDVWLSLAATQGLTHEDDAIAFTLHGLTRHPQFYRHPSFAPILAECAEHPQRYSRVTASISEAAWQRIATSLSARAD